MCDIVSNPDIVGIGVRTAIYAQNILSFVPAIWAIWDKNVEPFELESVETQSTTILITAFAILVSAIVQARTLGLTNFHAVIILNLSWMNNTNTFIWFLLFTQRIDWSDRTLRTIWVSLRPSKKTGKTRASHIFRYPVLLIGSLHLSLMAVLGIWLWAQPETFGKISPPCSMNSSVFLLGNRVPLSSPGLRDWSILVYTALLVPGLNLLLPIIPIIVFHIIWKRQPTSQRIVPCILGLALLAIVNIIFIVDTEVMLHSNTAEDEDLAWTFGQTLALLLLLVPLRDLAETFLMIREKKRKEEHTYLLREAVEKGETGTMKKLVESGANPNIQAPDGTKLPTALQLASFKGELELVQFLVEHGADVNLRGKQDASFILDE
ncbi:hypothetical protein DL96DRAFT_507756 [Flagelloscypha sp. PMI_526]|nr:hypothetical protein DL96DRAFT_507756 [Flagelloscypha sp. PMI_526]